MSEPKKKSTKKKDDAEAKPAAPQGPLTGRQRRHLRALGHHLTPVVQIGKQGLTEATLTAVSDALEQHELIKVRVGTECPEDRHDIAERMAPAVKGQVAQVLGRTVLIYRRHPKEPKIKLPKDE
jgi:RNA-binding protein